MANPRWHQMAIAGLQRVKDHPWRWTAILGLLGMFLLSSLANWLFDGWASANLWTPMSEFVKYLLSRPVGLVGLIVAGAILFLFVASFVDSSPNAKVFKSWLDSRKRPKEEVTPEAPKPPPLTADEENLVHFVRLFWKETGGRTTHRAVLVSQKLQEHLSSDDLLVELLSYPTIQLQATKDKLWEAFEYRQTHPDVIMRGLRELVERYMVVAQWINYCAEVHWLDLEQPPYLEPYPDIASWPVLHGQFKRELAILCARPGFAYLSHFHDHQMPDDRRQPPPGGLGEKAQAIDMSVRQRSEPEEQFLLLLGADAPNYGAPGGTVLAATVYQAGRELARKGVFVFREITEESVLVALFTVPNLVVPILKRRLFPNTEIKTEVRLRLDRVIGTVSSGSGIGLG